MTYHCGYFAQQCVALSHTTITSQQLKRRLHKRRILACLVRGFRGFTQTAVAITPSKCVLPRPPRLPNRDTRVTAGPACDTLGVAELSLVRLHSVAVVSIAHRPVWHCQIGERVCAGEIALRPPEPKNPSRYTPRPVTRVADTRAPVTTRIIPHKPK